MQACSAAPIAVPLGAPCEITGLKEARSLDRNARLAAAFVSNVADVASWRSAGYGNASIRLVTSASSGAPLDRVDICYYEGTFTVGGHPVTPAGGTFAPRYDLLVVTVDAAGHAGIATAGFRETMPLASPPHGR